MPFAQRLEHSRGRVRSAEPERFVSSVAARADLTNSIPRIDSRVATTATNRSSTGSPLHASETWLTTVDEANCGLIDELDVRFHIRDRQVVHKTLLRIGRTFKARMASSLSK